MEKESLLYDKNYSGPHFRPIPTLV